VRAALCEELSAKLESLELLQKALEHENIENISLKTGVYIYVYISAASTSLLLT
jgi:hypothetical protein